MRAYRSFLTKVFVVSTCLSAVASGGAVGPQADRWPIDLRRPDTWEAVVRNDMLELDRIADKLISVAQDTKRADGDRRRAILLLGEIETPRSTRFLVANIPLVLPIDVMIHDTDMVLGRPCGYALRGIDSGKRRWAAVPLMLRALSGPVRRERRVLMDYAAILRTICGRSIARGLVAAELGRCTEPLAKKNLETVQHFVD
jgi:hypothetical protein